ncbi:MAG: carboxypeptidase M32, partial [Bacteroidetes bacterium]|nr:carboxypeptidase M32 [Bacteroidota bacterium]
MITTSSTELYKEYRSCIQRIADIKNASAVLQWDQETYLPQKGAFFRGQQIATLTEIAHELVTGKKYADILQELVSRNDLPEKESRNVQLSWEEYTRQNKLNSRFVRAMSETVSKSFHAWIEARKENSFAVFEKELEELVVFKKEEASMIGYKHHPYEALMDEFEKGCTVAFLDKTFNNLRPPLKNLLDKIGGKQERDDSFLYLHYPKQQQWDFGIEIIKQLGFDFEAGRQDISEHPFTTSFNSNDVRITTRINENDFSSMLWGCIHETGHALYEQGLPESEYGLPLGSYTSLGIHESQSRLWENNVGRSLPFWKHNYTHLQKVFPEQLKEIRLDQFYSAINKVKPSLIRTEADELTYHFHVMIRYELEKLLIEGNLTAHAIPAYWNEQYAKYLDIKVTDDKHGCLQDV